MKRRLGHDDSFGHIIDFDQAIPSMMTLSAVQEIVEKLSDLVAGHEDAISFETVLRQGHYKRLTITTRSTRVCSTP